MMEQLVLLPAYYWLGLFIIIGTSLKGNHSENKSEENLLYSFSTNCKNRVARFEELYYSFIGRKRFLFVPFSAPLLKNTLRTIVQTPSAVQHYDGDSAARNFSGYFHPTRWTSDQLSGAGGVDVTGAPKSRWLVEGTNANLVKVANGRWFEFYLIIPVKGSLRIEWAFYGSSISTTSTIALFSSTFPLNGNRLSLLKAIFWSIDTLNDFMCSSNKEISSVSLSVQSNLFSWFNQSFPEIKTSYRKIYTACAA